MADDSRGSLNSETKQLILNKSAEVRQFVVGSSLRSIAECDEEVADVVGDGLQADAKCDGPAAPKSEVVDGHQLPGSDAPDDSKCSVVEAGGFDNINNNVDNNLSKVCDTQIQIGDNAPQTEGV